MEFDPPRVAPRTPNELSDGWRTVSFVTWVLAGAALLAVAITSRTIGRPIWWLGPPSDPASPLFLLVPVAIVVVPLVVTSKLPRSINRTNIACSVLLTATAVVDMNDSPAVALAVAVVGAMALAVSVSLLFVARQYR